MTEWNGGAREATGARGTAGGGLLRWSGQQPAEEASATAKMAGSGGGRDRARERTAATRFESMLDARRHGSEVSAKICGAELGAMYSGGEVPTT